MGLPHIRNISIGHYNGDFLQIEILEDLKEKKYELLTIKLIGCLPFLKQAQTLLQSLKSTGKLPSIDLTSRDHVALLFQELKQKIENTWNPPYHEEEVCHCRKVNLDIIQNAIVLGNHSVENLGKETSAGTNCGNCHPDLKNLLKYRLG